MKKVTFLYVVLVFLSFRAFAQTDNSKNDLQSLQVKPGITLVLKHLPPTLGLVFPEENTGSCTISFYGTPALILTTSLGKEDAACAA